MHAFTYFLSVIVSSNSIHILKFAFVVSNINIYAVKNIKQLENSVLKVE